MALNPVIKFTTLFGLLAVELAVKLTTHQGSTLTMLSALFFVISFVFVYRSFYGMRIRTRRRWKKPRRARPPIKKRAASRKVAGVRKKRWGRVQTRPSFCGSKVRIL